MRSAVATVRRMPTSRLRPALAMALAAGLLTACSTPGPPGPTGPEAGVTPSPPVSTATEDPVSGSPGSASPSAPVTEVVDHLLEVPPLHPSVDGYDETLLTIEAADRTVHRLAVKVARTGDEQRHGLMEVEDLPDGTGMWFVYETERDGGFWMYRTLVPLSIAFIGADGRIVDVIDMEPCPPEDGTDCPSYRPDADYLSALEVPQGWFARQGIAESDVVREDPA